MKQPISLETALSWLLLLFISFSLQAQHSQVLPAGEFQNELRKLDAVGTVLYVAAHPDDENQRIITYFANAHHLDTYYLSLTRGEGGQNLIGPELGTSLGLIRTQELMEARRIDGGHQLFTRAVDFGYSKDPTETFEKWDKEALLGDVVYLIRKIKPDVIITRFNTEAGGNHGHHTASAILAREAFHAAGDPNQFPEQVPHVGTWQPARLYWNAYLWGRNNEEEARKRGWKKLEVGDYNAFLGKSYTEIAAESRSMHKCQGFGAMGSRGSHTEYLEQWAGDPGTHPLEDLDVGWSRLGEAGKEIQKQVEHVIASYQPEAPQLIIDELLDLRTLLESIPPPYRERKIARVDRLIASAAGLYVEAVASDYLYTPGSSIPVEMEVTSRTLPMKLLKVHLSDGSRLLEKQHHLEVNRVHKFNADINLKPDHPLSQPWWLEKAPSEVFYHIDSREKLLRPDKSPAINLHFVFQVADRAFTLRRPLIYKRTDPVKGETHRWVEIGPPITLSTSDDLYVFPTHEARSLQISLEAQVAGISGVLRLSGAENWKLSERELPFSFDRQGEQQTLSVEITPPHAAETSTLTLAVEVEGHTYDQEIEVIQYDHIRTQTWFPDASIKLIHEDIQIAGKQVGYLPGAGDAVPEALERIGYEVSYITEDMMDRLSPRQFDAIVVGIRAFNTTPWLPDHLDHLFSYIEEGGTVVVQYNTSYRLNSQRLAPRNLSLSRSRITRENAPVTISNPDHKLMNYPNPISAHDFQDWVQERGLYFPGSWDAAFETVLTSRENGEDPLEGGILVLPHGKGHYIYTSYSWFRQLPAGVPGAYKLFANMLGISEVKSN